MMKMDTAARHEHIQRRLSYEYWTIEELRALGAQLQVRDAQRKCRRELLEILEGGAANRWRGHA